MSATAQELTNIGIDAIIKKAVILARDPEWDKWKVYGVAKKTIEEVGLTSGEYEKAVRSLAEALNI